MRYAALVAASTAVVAVLILPRDGRGEAAPRAAAPVTAQSRTAERARDGQEDFRWSGRVARGKTIEIAGLLGNVRAEHTSGDQVEVVGRRMGDDADQVRIEVVQKADGDVLICTIYPVRESSRGRNDRNRDRDRDDDRRDDGPCNDGHSGELALDADEARIDFTVRVPQGVHLAARTVDGDIEASGLRSPVDAASVSGNVRVSTTGTARAATVSGNVDATFGETDGDEMSFASVSGNVVVRVANGVGAEVEAQHALRRHPVGLRSAHPRGRG